VGGIHHISDPEGDIRIPAIAPELVSEIVIHTKMLIEQIDRTYLVDSNLVFIVLEELPSYLHGNKLAQDIARVIQSRVQTYLWELR